MHAVSREIYLCPHVSRTSSQESIFHGLGNVIKTLDQGRVWMATLTEHSRDGAEMCKSALQGVILLTDLCGALKYNVKIILQNRLG